MVRKYLFGEPFVTDAVVETLKTSQGPVPYFDVSEPEGGALVFTRRMEKDDKVYGLGENMRGINKRGYHYISNCTDDPNHTEEKTSLYAAHNFLLVEGEKEIFGVFFDFPGQVVFDVGYWHRDRLEITLAEKNCGVYIIEGTEKIDVVKQFRRAIGRSYIPPKWAFGYGQSRWSYFTADEVREVAREHREHGLPLDSIYLDIDYMERYKDFTVDKEAFPDLPGLSAELKEQGIHLVPIIDAGVKVEEGYPVYEEGVSRGYFCKDENGEDFTAAVWPGRVHFPDVLNKEAREWFGNYYKVLLDMGIEGFWNDMNEPAIFYSEKRLLETMEALEGYKGKNLDLKTFQEFQGLVMGLSNSPEDYRSFYHNADGGRVRHDKVHNLFGYYMTRAAGEAFERLEPEKRILMFSRSSYIGMHRYGGIWTGDNKSWWSHLLLNLHMMPSLNMCGILYTGADLGGFGADATEELLLRWLALGVFTPLMRNHAAMGTRRQEAYRFDDLPAFSRMLGLRYVLLPYIYSEFVKAALNDTMYFAPLSFVFPEDAFADQAEDELMVGDSLLIAPVYTQNAKGRYVYLPERMMKIVMRSSEDIQCQMMEAGHHYVEMPLDALVFFLRKDRLLPISHGGSCVRDTDFEHLKVLAFVETKAQYMLYDDDGYSKHYDDPKHYTAITVDADGSLSVEGAKEISLISC